MRSTVAALIPTSPREVQHFQVSLRSRAAAYSGPLKRVTRAKAALTRPQVGLFTSHVGSPRAKSQPPRYIIIQAHPASSPLHVPSRTRVCTRRRFTGSAVLDARGRPAVVIEVSRGACPAAHYVNSIGATTGVEGPGSSAALVQRRRSRRPCRTFHEGSTPREGPGQWGGGRDEDSAQKR